jgi:uncharacterized protein (DUF1697 family)
MTRYVAFLRAINVGGRVVKMDRLRNIVETVGVSKVSTFIASGNVLFESKKSAAQLEASIESVLRAALGYEVATMLRSFDELQDVVSYVEENEFARGDGAMLYVGFLKRAPAASAAKAVAALSNEIDTVSVHGRELYWQCRKTFSQSTVTGARLEKLLGVPATIRNFTTLARLASRAHR